MSKTIHLIRHGHHGLLAGVLCGRMPGVGLDDLGREQMRLAAGSLHPRPDIIQASPQLRAQQSAQIVAHYFDLGIETASAVDEIDMGDWTGRTFESLQTEEAWRAWNARRGSTSPPKGESMGHLQARVLRHIESLRDRPDESVVIVSHAEPIRAMVLHCLDMPLDDFHEVDIAPASITTLVYEPDRLRLVAVNFCPAEAAVLDPCFST